ncbi:chitin deacetylase, partial [Halobacteriales archaeon QH_10_67_22]
STPDGGTDAGSTDQQLADSDGDGTIDSADYAPRDPDVQERSDLESTTDGSGPGFGVGTAFVAVLVLLAVVGTRR